MGNQNTVKFVYNEHIWNMFLFSFKLLFVIALMICTYKLSFWTNISVIVNKWGTHRQVSYCNYWSLLGIHNVDAKVVHRWIQLYHSYFYAYVICKDIQQTTTMADRQRHIADWYNNKELRASILSVLHYQNSVFYKITKTGEC